MSEPASPAGRPNGTREVGVIYDIGFRHYTGPRLGRGYLLRSLYVESLKGAYGLGRAARSKVMPFILLAFMVAPALIIAVVTTITNATELPLAYTNYAIQLQLVVLIYLGVQAPASVSRDLRFKMMPLYFSRPLRRSDYVLAKYAAMLSALFLLMALPLFVLYAGALLAKLPFWAQTRGLLAGLAGVVFFAAVLGGMGLLIASITPRRGFGVAAVITVILVVNTVGIIVQGLADSQGKTELAGWAGLIAPWTLVDGVQVWLLGAVPSSPQGPPGTLGGIGFLAVAVALVLATFGLLLLRYRKVSAS